MAGWIVVIENHAPKTHSGAGKNLAPPTEAAAEAFATIEKIHEGMSQHAIRENAAIETNLSKYSCIILNINTFATEKSKKNINIMKALIIIAACLVLALILKVVDILTSMKRINSVGARSNNLSKEMPKIDLNNPEEVKKAMEYYKDLID